MCRATTALALLTLAWALPSPAQGTAPTWVGAQVPDALEVRAEPGGDGRSLLTLRWADAGGGALRFEVERAPMSPSDPRLDLADALVAAMDLYLDAHVRYGKLGAEADLPLSTMVGEMAELVGVAAARCAPGVAFPGWSNGTRTSLERLVDIRWERMHTVDAGEEDRYLALYFHLRNEQQALARAMRVDLAMYAGIDPRSGATDSGSALTIDDEGTICYPLPEDTELMCALDMLMDPFDPEDHSSADGIDAGLIAGVRRSAELLRGRLKRSDRTLLAEVDALHARLDRMGRTEAQWQEKVAALEGELAVLRALVAVHRSNPGPGPYAELETDFVQEGRELSEHSRVQVAALVRGAAAGDRFLIRTMDRVEGHRDPGRRRAQAVRLQLQALGVPAERISEEYLPSGEHAVRTVLRCFAP